MNFIFLIKYVKTKRVFRILLFFVFFTSQMDAEMIYKFSRTNSLKNWYVTNDDVMGGVSLGNLMVDDRGLGIFRGSISLENNGGFSSIRYRINKMKVESNKIIVLKVYGDGKYYQFRIKENKRDRHVYIKSFFAKKGWSEIKIPINKMKPSFRGRSLNMERFNHEVISELGILFGNKIEENFELIIDSIKLE